MDQPLIDRASAQLLAVRRGGPPLAGLGADAPADLPTAFGIQLAVLRGTGGMIGGWKCAAVPDKQATGAMLDARGVLPGPAQWFVPRGQKIGLETEIAFRVCDRLPGLGRPYTRDEVLAAMDGCCPAVELVASRYQDPAKASVFEAVADNVAHDGMVFGADVPGWRDMDLAKLTVRQTHAGAVQVEKVGGNPAGDPIISLTWLANFLPSIGLALEPGQMVITGSCTGLTWVDAGDAMRGEFLEFGGVDVTLVPA